MDILNIIASLLTIASFIFAVITKVSERSLRRHLEAGLLGIINQADKLNEMSYEDGITNRHLAIRAADIRDHAIALLKSFSSREERFKTFDFAMTGKSLEKRIKQRKDSLGSKYSGGSCIAAGQSVSCPTGSRAIESLSPGDSVLAYDTHSSTLVSTRVKALTEFMVDRCVKINGRLILTETHKVFCLREEWKQAAALSLNEGLLNDRLEEHSVVSLERLNCQTRAFAVNTDQGNLFVSGILVHNKNGSG